MTSGQIENFRKVLALTLGPYAFLATREEIMHIKDSMQTKIDHDFKKDKEVIEESTK